MDGYYNNLDEGFISYDNPFPPSPCVSYPASQTDSYNCPCACRDRANHSSDAGPCPGCACSHPSAGERARHGDGEVAIRADAPHGRHDIVGVVRENGVLEVACGNRLYPVASLCDGRGHSLGFGPCHGVEA